MIMASETTVDRRQLKSVMEDLQLKDVDDKLKEYLPDANITDIMEKDCLYKMVLIYAAKISCMEFSRKMILAEFMLVNNNLSNDERSKRLTLISFIKETDFVGVEKLLKLPGNEFMLRLPLGYNLLTVLLFFGCSSEFLDFLITKIGEINFIGHYNSFINGADSVGLTPLIASILAGNAECMKHLLDKGADVNKRNRFAVHKTVKTLKNDNAMYNEDAMYGHIKTPLMYAVCVENVGCVETLLNYKPSVDVTANGHFVFEYAVLTSNITILKLLLDSSSHSVSTKFFPFCSANESKDDIEKKAEITEKGEEKSGCTSDSFYETESAIDCGNKSIQEDGNKKYFEFQPKAAFNFNATPESVSQDNNPFTKQTSFTIGKMDKTKPDSRSKAKQRQKTTQKFHTQTPPIDNKPQQNIAFASNENVFSYNNDQSKFSCLNSNSSSSEFGRALRGSIQCAIVRGDKDCLQVLLDHPSNTCDIDGLLPSGKSALILASENGKDDCVELLLQKGADPNNIPSFSEGTALTMAAQNGNLKCLKLLLKHNASLELPNRCRDTALICAVQVGQLNILTTLLNHGANVNAESKNNQTALMLAIKLNRLDCFKVLLEHNAYVDTKDILNDSPLSLLIEKDEIEYLDILLQYKPNLNVKFKNDLTPLVKAVLENNVKAVKLLLKHGAKINVSDNQGMNALIHAVSQGKLECTNLIVDELNKRESKEESESSKVFHFNAESEKPGDSTKDIIERALPYSLSEDQNEECFMLLLPYCSFVDHVDDFGNTSLILASKQGKVEIMQMLMEKNADVNLITQQEVTVCHIDGCKKCTMKCMDSALIIAARFGQLGSLTTLLNHGANVNAVTRNKQTALMLAIQLDHWDCFKVLLEHNACVDTKDSRNDGPLSLFIEKDEIEYLDVLLRYKPNLDAQFGGNLTSLIKAVLGNKVDVVDMLLKHGAKISILDDEGKNALIYAVSEGKLECTNLIMDELKVRKSKQENESLKTGVLNERLNSSIKNMIERALPYSLSGNQNKECFLSLLPHCSFVDHVDDSGKTPLMLACESGKMECVKMLIERNANVNIVTQQEETAVILAASGKQSKCLELLLTNNADPDSGFDCDGAHALFVAVDNQDYESARLLVKYGADVNRMTSDGVSAMMLTLFKMPYPYNRFMKLLRSAGGKVDISDLYVLEENNWFQRFIFDLEVLQFILRENMLVKEKTFENPAAVVLTSPHYVAVRAQIFKCMGLLMKYDVFDWNIWCKQYDVDKSVLYFINLGVRSQFPPCSNRVSYKNGKFCFLECAILSSHENVVRYLLSNLYLTWNDYVSICKRRSLLQSVSNLTTTKRLLNNAWPLEYLCLLKISTVLFNGKERKPSKRDEMVNSLSIPDKFKDILKFKLDQASLCPKHWDKIEEAQSNSRDFLKVSNPLSISFDHLSECEHCLIFI